MKILVYLERLERMHQLISKRNTGSPSEFARKLHISPSRLYRILDEMRDLGAPISYDRQIMSYYYKKPYDIEIVFRFKEK